MCRRFWRASRHAWYSLFLLYQRRLFQRGGHPPGVGLRTGPAGILAEEPHEIETKWRGCRGVQGFALVQLRGGQTLVYCRAVGTTNSMTKVLRPRDMRWCSNSRFWRAPKRKDITLFIAGHGTEQNDNSRKAIERQAYLFCAFGTYGAVHAVFMEEDPRISDCYQLAKPGTSSWCLSSSATDCTSGDIPVLLGEPTRVIRQRLRDGQPTWRNPTGKNGKIVWYAPSVGTDSRIAEVIMERVREAADEIQSRKL